VCSLQAGWTDAWPADLFVTVAAGRTAFRVADLVALSELLTGLTLEFAFDDIAQVVRDLQVGD
jgi:hypothetical protein